MNSAECTSDKASMALCHVVTPVGMLGYGFNEAETSKALAELSQTGVATAIILDSGSTDSGPAKLALGSMTCPRSAYVTDLTKLLHLADTFQTPLIIGSAGGDGTGEHVSVMEDIVTEITSQKQNEHYRFKVISILSDISKDTVTERLRAGRITGCGACVPPLTDEDVQSSTRIVAQMGPEAFSDAMEADPDFDVIIGGRAYDPSPYVGYCIFQLKRQFPNLTSAEVHERIGGFLHMGKIMECGGQCSTPKSHGAVSTIFVNGEFDVRPLSPSSRCTPLSVAAHTLYENTQPDILRGPGGALHLQDCKYEQLGDGRTVRVRGAKFRSSKQSGLPYQFKLEAARLVGYRSMFMGFVKDSILTTQIDALLGGVRKYVAAQHAEITENWDLDFHVHGNRQTIPEKSSELFIVAESLAPTQQLATSIASKARIAMIHGPYPGQKATSGNFAFGIGGLMEIELGQCAQFSIYHLMELDAGEERLYRSNFADNSDQKTGIVRSNVKMIGNGSLKENKPDTSSVDLGEMPKEVVTSSKQSVESNMPPQPKWTIHNQPQTLSDLSRILRSKNAGPFEITIDAIFASELHYKAVKESGLWSAENISQCLGIELHDILWIGSFDPALAFKVTIPRMRAGRRVAAGGFMESDVHGSQQHTAIAALQLPGSVLSSILFDEEDKSTKQV